MIANTIVAIAINKNAGNDAEEQIDNTTSNSVSVSATDLVFLNGSSDYVQVGAFQQSGSALNTQPGKNTVFVTLELLP